MFDGYKAIKRVRELEDDFRTLKNRFEELELRWADTLDRIKRIMGRIEKRSALDDAVAAAGAESSTTLASGVSTLGSALTPRQALIQRQILAARQARGIKPDGGEK